MRDDDDTTYAPSICPKCNELHVKDFGFKKRLKNPPIKKRSSFEILLRYLIPGLIQFDKSEYIRFIIYLAIAILGVSWIVMFDNLDGFVVGIIIFLSVWIPSVIKSTRYFFNSKQKEIMNRNDSCPTCETQVIFYNNPSLQKECKNTLKTKEEWRWSSEELYWKDFWLPKTKYYCPKCKKMKMEFAMTGWWD